jgi:hypothetical protein
MDFFNSNPTQTTPAMKSQQSKDDNNLNNWKKRGFPTKSDYPKLLNDSGYVAWKPCIIRRSKLDYWYRLMDPSWDPSQVQNGSDKELMNLQYIFLKKSLITLYRHKREGPSSDLTLNLRIPFGNNTRPIRKTRTHLEVLALPLSWSLPRCVFPRLLPFLNSSKNLTLKSRHRPKSCLNRLPMTSRSDSSQRKSHLTLYSFPSIVLPSRCILPLAIQTLELHTRTNNFTMRQIHPTLQDLLSHPHVPHSLRQRLPHPTNPDRKYLVADVPTIEILSPNKTQDLHTKSRQGSHIANIAYIANIANTATTIIPKIMFTSNMPIQTE